VSNSFILRLVSWYLLGVPLVTSINGLSMHILGVSLVGPLYHAAFSLILIGMALISDSVEKSWTSIATLFGIFGLIVGVQLAEGFSYLSDIGTLYRWFMPLLLFAVYWRWSYLRTDEGRAALVSVFHVVPLWYSGLIITSFLVYLLTGFQATLFEEGAKRFTGFTWAFNPVVNVFFICAYVNFLLETTSLVRTSIYGFAFFNLLSKTTLAYYAVAALGVARRSWQRAKPFGALRSVVAVPAMALVLALGVRQSLTSAAIIAASYGGGPQGVSATSLYKEQVVQRGAWAAFAVQDIPQWPAVNLVFGNGIEVDRRLINPLWAASIGVAQYRDVELGKGNKTSELDVLGPLDMFGFVGMTCFAAVFYVYPFVVTRLPAFRLYYTLLVGLSLLSGHLINNPQATTLLVFFILVTRDYVHRPINRDDAAVRVARFAAGE
jgi:hypothetical protein